MSTENIKSVKEHLKLQAWSLEVKEQQESGLSATAWCKIKGIKPSSYFHRLKRVREVALECTKIAAPEIVLPVKTPTFAEIDLMKRQNLKEDILTYEATSTVTVNLNGATIEIPGTASIDLVESILKVVKAL